MTTVYLMGTKVETSKRTGKPYAVAILMDEKGRRQNLFMPELVATKVNEKIGELITTDLKNLKPLDADIDAFTNQLEDLKLQQQA